jgi:hypothetical protein
VTQLIRHRAQLDAAGSVFTAYFEAPTTGTVGECQEAADRVHACLNGASLWCTSLLSVAPNSFVDLLDRATGEITDRVAITPGAVIAGAASGDSLPTRNQYVLSYRTGHFVGGREVIGRGFVVGAAEAANDSSGHVGATPRANLTTAAGLLGTTVSTAIAHVVWHRPVLGAGGLTVVVNSWTCNTRFGSLRSRAS